MRSNSSKSYGLGPFIALTLIYFVVGFLTTVTGQCQGPLKVAFLSHVGNLRNTFVTLIPFFFFLGYLLNGTRGGKWIQRVGYKATLIRGMLFMLSGLVAFFLSSWISILSDNFPISFQEIKVPYGYFIFLLGSYLMGTSAAILQVVINPYIALYPLSGTQAVQRMNIVCAINSLGTTVAPFFVSGILFRGLDLEQVTVNDLMIPFLAIALVVGIMTIVSRQMSLPSIEEESPKEREGDSSNILRSFSHLRWGIITIFFYVGAEVSLGVNINLHAIESIDLGEKISFFGSENISLMGLKLGIPALLATLYWGGLMVGRMISSTLSRISPRVQLSVTTLLSMLFLLIGIASNNLWVLVAVGLFHSVMWGCIFTLSIQGLKQYTSKASGYFMCGVFGGAVFPMLQGVLADTLGSWQYTWLLVFVCEAVMFYYALWGSKVKESELR